MLSYSMKQYNCDIENGIKSSYFSLRELKLNSGIDDSQVDQALNLLQGLIEKAQQGEINHYKGIEA